MADWTVIPDTAVDPDAPLTSDLAYAWRDNPIAIAEGAASAPRVMADAHPDFIVGSTVVDRCTVPGLVGTVAAGLVFVPFHFTAIKSYDLRFYFEWGRVSGSTPITVDILRNGVSAASTTFTTGGFNVQTFDLSVTAGENMAFQFTSGSGNVIQYRNLQIRANQRGTYRT